MTSLPYIRLIIGSALLTCYGIFAESTLISRGSVTLWDRLPIDLTEGIDASKEALIDNKVQAHPNNVIALAAVEQARPFKRGTDKEARAQFSHFGEFSPYVERFFQAVDNYTIAINLNGPNLKLMLNALEIRFGTIAHHKISGTCAGMGTGRLTVDINEFHWREASEDRREFVIFHELGHCLLSRPHEDRMIADKDGIEIPGSIMYARPFPTWAYRKYRDHYLTEFFLNVQPTAAFGSFWEIMPNVRP